MGLHQTKNLLHRKENNHWTERQPKNGRKGANYTSDKGLITKIFRELKK
jgi:hypothetical protein